jgi:hypothetical protein
MYDLFERTWKPVEVKIDMAVLLFPFGAETAGVRRGASRQGRYFGSAVNA